MFFHNNHEQVKKAAAIPYKDDDFGLFEAIDDENADAVKGLIQFFGHRINCHVMGGGYSQLNYMEYPTPLSFALSRNNVNIAIVKLLLELGADIKDDDAIKFVKKSQSCEIRKLFNFPVNIEPVYIDSVEANDLSSLNTKKIVLGSQLLDAFHNKQDTDKIRELVRLDAPVNYRLDYGLEVKLESDFVAQFYLLLEGDESEERLLENATKVLGDKEKAIHLVNYVKTGLEIFGIFHSQDANTEEVKINPEFLKFIESNAPQCRANPDHANGSLIIAAGLRDKEFASRIINVGKVAQNELHNGATVNFRGYFGDNAAVWSAILLDKNTLDVLLDNGSDIHEIGITKSSLLHWVVLADRLENTPERQKKAFEIAQMLLMRGARLDTPNIIGKTPIDYARGILKELLYKSQQEITKSHPSMKA